MEVPLVFLLSVVLESEQMSFPVFELLASILIQTEGRVAAGTAFLQILVPGGGDHLVVFLVGGSN